MSCEDVQEEAWTGSPIWTADRIRAHYATQLREHGPGPLAVQSSAAAQEVCFKRLAVALAPLPPGLLLDVGCGIGDLVPYVPAGWGYVGLDYTPELIAAARARYPAHVFLHGDAARERFADGAVDVALLCKVFSYTCLEDARLVVQAAWKWARLGLIWLDNQFLPADSMEIVRSLKGRHVAVEVAAIEAGHEEFGVMHMRYLVRK